LKDQEYLDEINKALLNFQMVEEALKICIGLSYEIIAKTIPADMTFKFDPSSVNSAPLGNLIKMFSKISKNEVLISDLKKIVEWRNFCAHSAFSHEFLNRKSVSRFSEHSAQDLKKVVDFSSDLVLRLTNEIKDIRTIHIEVTTNQNA
jgi:hypothetical protein